MSRRDSGERTMRGFKSMGQTQRFLAVHGRDEKPVCNPATSTSCKKNYRLFQTEAFDMCQQVTCA